MTTQTAAIEKWLLVQIFIKLWLRIQVQKKNAESCRSRLRHFGPWPPLLSTSRVFHIKLLFSSAVLWNPLFATARDVTTKRRNNAKVRAVQK